MVPAEANENACSDDAPNVKRELPGEADKPSGNPGDGEGVVAPKVEPKMDDVDG